MRLLSAALGLALLTTLPAFAAAVGWTHYDNARFGYRIDIPPGFSCGSEADSKDGRSCQSADGAVLLVWGGYAGVVNGDGFAGEVKFDRDADVADGLSITYLKTTPHWAVYSGTRSGSIVYKRLIEACKGSQYAAFELDYPPAQGAEMGTVIAGLAASPKQRSCDDTAAAN